MAVDLTDAERYRSELAAYCYRMLGSAFEAEDAVQETMIRAWRSADRFDPARASVRTWMYTIATNICLDMLRSAQRRARAVDLGPASSAGADIGTPRSDATWIEPFPGGDPADVITGRETLRLAFVAALQLLPPRQRAVLILRDVLVWTAAEVARLLDVSVAAVNSALQRARSTLGSATIDPADAFDPLDADQQSLLVRYADAFERYDIDVLVSLLHEDATMSMPPFSWWLRGRQEIRRAFAGSAGACQGLRLVGLVANGQPAFAQYAPRAAGGYEPWALVVLDISDGRIVATTSFLDTARWFPLFELPADPFAAHR